MEGSATFTTVPSRTIISMPTHSTYSAIQRERSVWVVMGVASSHRLVLRPRRPRKLIGLSSRHGHLADDRAPGGGPQRRRGRVRPPDRALSRRAARPLLPHARLRARRGGRAPGGAPARLAGALALRGPQLVALLALHHRHQRLPQPDRPPP